MPIDDQTKAQLAAFQTVDLVTRGRRSGRVSSVEIWWFRVDDRFIITGTPGPRDWYANVLSDSRIAIHAAGTEYPATAVPISDPDFRRRVFTDPDISWYATQSELDDLVARAPMIEVLL